MKDITLCPLDNDCPPNPFNRSKRHILNFFLVRSVSDLNITIFLPYCSLGKIKERIIDNLLRSGISIAVNNMPFLIDQSDFCIQIKSDMTDQVTVETCGLAC